jgi:hypothetical protein
MADDVFGGRGIRMGYWFVYTRAQRKEPEAEMVAGREEETGIGG